MTSDGNGNPNRAATVLHPVEEPIASKTGEYNETVIIDNAALVRALLQPRAHRLPVSSLIGVPEVFKQAFYRVICPLKSRNRPRETSAVRAATHGSFRRCLGPETGQEKMESRRISSTPRQRRSCRPPDECVFGASPALHQTLRGRPTRRLGSTAGTLAASSSPSQVNAFCLVLFDLSGRMSNALAWKGELVRAICLEHARMT